MRRIHAVLLCLSCAGAVPLLGEAALAAPLDGQRLAQSDYRWRDEQDYDHNRFRDPYHPPPPRFELKGRMPHFGMIWVRGEWVWSGDGWRWERGHWAEGRLRPRNG